MDIETRIGPYEIRERIGEGGMATVYKAWHTGLHRFEALKVPRAGAYGSDPEFVQRLLNEARLAARLHHPHIVAIHSISEADATRQYFAMDLVEGTDLSQVLEERGRLPYEEAAMILRQTADALDHAHAQGVIHRDIKPDNILLQIRGDSWWVRVVDFGISRAAEDTSGTRLTKSGMLVGTPEYMSPEQSGSGEVVDYRTDIYSLGVLAYEMLTGEPPFTAGDGVSRMSILLSHVRNDPKPLSEIVPDLPPHIEAAVLKALSKKADDRFPTCGAFVAAFGAETNAASGDTSLPATAGAIQSTLNGTPTPTSLPGNLSPTKQPTSRQPARPYAVWLLLAAFTLAALLPFVLNRNPVGTLGREGLDAVNTPASNSVPATTADATATTAPTKESTPQATATLPAATTTAVPTTVGPALRVATVKRLRTVPFTRQTRQSTSLLRGQSRVLQSGRSGVREVTLAITYRGEQEMQRRVLSERVVQETVPQITLQGTRVPVRARPARRTIRREVEQVRPRASTVRRERRNSVRQTRRNRPRIRRPRSGGEAPLPP